MAMRFGAKAALHDARTMAELDVELLEVHLMPDDLPLRHDSIVSTFRDIREEMGHDLVVHAPEFMPVPGEPLLLDLASPDDQLRSMASASIVAAIDVSQDMEAALVVVHPGGIHPSANSLGAEGGIDRLKDALAPLLDRARDAAVALTLENMPWFYHRKLPDGGRERWESTILVAPDDMEALSGSVDGLTLDVSHGYLHSPRGGMEAIEGFIERFGDQVMHLHLSDALPPDHEGLQIGEGAVDFEAVLSAFSGRDISAVPEIIGGHRGGGIPFNRALEELKRIEAGP
jgi:N-acetylneuraminate synthase